MSQSGEDTEVGKRPSPRGGPAALSGFLHQIILTLGQTALYRINGKASGKKLKDAQLVLEPSTGGDADFDGVVVQYKTKTTGHWTPAEIVKRVLPDLLRAVQTRDSVPSKLIFSTDAPPGDMDQFLDFLKRVKSVATISDVDRKHSRTALRRKSSLTDLEVLNEVARSIAEDEEETPPLDAAFSLLQRLELEFSATRERAEATIERILLEFVSEKENIKEKRDSLLMQLFEWAANGNYLFSAEELFNAAGIRSIPLSSLEKIRQNLASHVNNLLPSVSYEPSLDVRPPLSTDLTAPIILITGESGLGKTWGLCRTLVHLASSEWCIFGQLDSNQNFYDLTKLIAREFCLYGWEQDAVCELEALTRRIHYLYEDQRPRLLVFLTGNPSQELFKRIVSHDWNRWGIRIFIECPLDMVDSLRPVPSNVFRVDVKHFSGRERGEYLRRCDILPSSIPLDIQELLRTPIFCRMYAELSRAGRWCPTNEYELIDNYWDSKFGDVLSSRPSARAAFFNLVYETAKEKYSYPWTAQTLFNVGLPDETYQSLVRVGALSEHGNGQTRIWHDRILNWALAIAIAHKAISGSLNQDELASFLFLLSENNPISGVNFGYVLLDFIWIYESIGPEDRGPLLDAFLNLEGMKRKSDDWFYEEGLPTLGEMGARLLIDRLFLIEYSDEEGGHFRYRIRKGLFKAAKYMETAAFAQFVQALLLNPGRASQITGLEIAERFPHRTLLPTIWLFTRDREEVEEATSEETHYRMLARDALDACVRADGSEWLDAQLGQTQQTNDRLRTLVHLAAQLPIEAAKRIWKTIAIDCSSIRTQSAARLPV